MSARGKADFTGEGAFHDPSRQPRTGYSHVTTNISPDLLQSKITCLFHLTKPGIRQTNIIGASVQYLCSYARRLRPWNDGRCAGLRQRIEELRTCSRRCERRAMLIQERFTTHAECPQRRQVNYLASLEPLACSSYVDSQAPRGALCQVRTRHEDRSDFCRRLSGSTRLIVDPAWEVEMRSFIGACLAVVLIVERLS